MRVRVQHEGIETVKSYSRRAAGVEDVEFRGLRRLLTRAALRVRDGFFTDSLLDQLLQAAAVNFVGILPILPQGWG
jgi:hypothetical protein